MPKEINGHQREVALIPDQEEDGFYFSSVRNGGLGGWDIYYISYREGQFGIPVNLGENINTDLNEAFFSVLDGRIYFCSDKNRNGQDYDIVSRFLPGQKHLKFRIHDNQGAPVMAESEIHRIFTDKMPVISKYNSDEKGMIAVLMENNLDSMDFFIEKKGYLPYYRKIENYDLMNSEIDVTLVPVKESASFSVDAIYFDYEKADIKKESLVYLDKLADYLRLNPEIKLKIIGHTDLHGSTEYNLELSERRAESVRIYLTSRGVQAARLQSIGVGKSSPVIEEISNHADRLNRRTEFLLMN